MATVMLVDDSRTIRSSLGRLLRAAGHTVVAEADNGCDAFERYAMTTPDLVFMDNEMPCMNGLDAMRKILYYYPEAKIIMISGDSHVDHVKRASRLGAKHYLVKPVQDSLLLLTIDTVLNDESQSNTSEE